MSFKTVPYLEFPILKQQNIKYVMFINCQD